MKAYVSLPEMAKIAYGFVIRETANPFGVSEFLGNERKN